MTRLGLVVLQYASAARLAFDPRTDQPNVLYVVEEEPLEFEAYVTAREAG